MRIHLIAVGTRMPAWVRAGFADYAARLPRECSLALREIAPARRAGNPGRWLRAEGERIRAAIPAGAYRIALDERGREWSTSELAERLARWLQEGRDLALLVGGPDGLEPACREGAEQTWSLSRLTLPHALVRVVVAEQLYRAWSLLHGHPYHRA